MTSPLSGPNSSNPNIWGLPPPRVCICEISLSMYVLISVCLCVCVAISVQHEGPCRLHCGMALEYRPVCGSDGVQYPNQEALSCQALRRPDLSKWLLNIPDRTEICPPINDSPTNSIIQGLMEKDLMKTTSSHSNYILRPVS